MSQAIENPSGTISSAGISPTWIPLVRLRAQFEANLAALRQRDTNLADRLSNLKPAAEYFIAPHADSMLLGAAPIGGGDVAVLANPLPPAKAREIVARIFPAAAYNQPILVAGLDQGWLWNALYKLPCACGFAPGLRMPIYLLTNQIERLWAVLHYQSWKNLLADPRVQLIGGETDSPPQTQQPALQELAARLGGESRLMLPAMAVTVEPALWSDGQTLQSLTQTLAAQAAGQIAAIHGRGGGNASAPAPELAAKFRADSLRVLGITSRYTTFLQYSMRDWLAAMQKLGHQTRLLIEEQDHEILSALAYARVCQEFQPDLILIIDHCRGELPGLPQNVPCVMWIQDRLPNIFCAKAGAAQKRLDYVIGHGGSECDLLWKYPADRFMPCAVGVNEDRFAFVEDGDSESSSGALEQYRCDVSFVSHASATAETIVEEESRHSPNLAPMWREIHERLAAIYASGQSVTEHAPILALVRQAIGQTGAAADAAAVTDVVKQRLNNAMLRHQAIGWVADMGVDLRLYGRGWEKHPRFSRFARGVADNQRQLAAIYRASRVNLQVMPFGAAHQRSFEGLCAGGFFLIRGVSGDRIDQLKEQCWNLLRRRGIRDADEMMERGKNDPEFVALWNQLLRLMHHIDPPWLFASMREMAAGRYCQSAAQLWPDYDRVVFWNREELIARARHFLDSPGQRREIARSMRQRVLQFHTYTAISRRMLALIADDLAAAKADIPLAA